MMLKRVLLLAGAGVFFLCSTAYAQVGGYGTGACCKQGVPQLPAGQKCMLLHQVGPGENLHILAAYYYGDARAWRRIYNLNKKTLKNPNIIMVGQILKIEVDDPCWTPRYDLREFLQLEQRRMEALQRGRGKIKEIRTHQVVEPTVQVIIEETEEGVETEIAPGNIPGIEEIPRIAPPEPETPPAGGAEEGGQY